MSIVKQWYITRWNKGNINEIPDNVGVYVLMNRDEKVIKVGLAKELYTRLMQHWSTNDYSSTYYFRCYQCSNYENAERLEKKLRKEYGGLP